MNPALLEPVNHAKSLIEWGSKIVNGFAFGGMVEEKFGNYQAEYSSFRLSALATAAEVLGSEHPIVSTIERTTQQGTQANTQSIMGALQTLVDLARRDKLQVPGVAVSRSAATRAEEICESFFAVACALRDRRHERAPLLMVDEYDVQYLLHALLRSQFDDVRPEEWTPSYAGGSSRMDFLLKREQIVVEVKMAREGLKAARLGEELLVDIARYSTHPNCKTLVCFVYDPLGVIGNARGVEADLEQQGTKSGLPVRVFIRPK